MKAYSQDLRDRVIFTYKNDQKDPKQLATIFQICSKTAENWIKKFEETGGIVQSKALAAEENPDLMIKMLC